MKNLSLDNIEDILLMVDTECPENIFEELVMHQPNCQKMDSCFECWYRTVRAYQSEQSLKSMNDESEDK